MQIVPTTKFVQGVSGPTGPTVNQIDLRDFPFIPFEKPVTLAGCLLAVNHLVGKQHSLACRRVGVVDPFRADSQQGELLVGKAGRGVPAGIFSPFNVMSLAQT